MWICYPGHDGVHGNNQTDLLTTREPAIGILSMNKADNLKIIYQQLLVDDTISSETVYSRMLEVWFEVWFQQGHIYEG